MSNLHLGIDFWFKLQRSLRRLVKRDETKRDTPREFPNRDRTLQLEVVQILAAAVAIQSVVVGDTACSQMRHDWVNPSGSGDRTGMLL